MNLGVSAILAMNNEANKAYDDVEFHLPPEPEISGNMWDGSTLHIEIVDLSPSELTATFKNGKMDELLPF